MGNISVDSIHNKIKELDRLMTSIPSRIVSLEKELRACDEETQDLLHVIEMTRFHASEGYNLSSEMKKIRNRRREAKDELELLKNLQESFKKHRPMNHQINSTAKIIGEQKRKEKTRRYHLRVRKEFAEKLEKTYEKRTN